MISVGRTLPVTDYTDITPTLEEPESEQPQNITQAHVFERLNEMPTSDAAREKLNVTVILFLICIIWLN